MELPIILKTLTIVPLHHECPDDSEDLWLQQAMSYNGKNKLVDVKIVGLTVDGKTIREYKCIVKEPNKSSTLLTSYYTNAQKTAWTNHNFLARGLIRISTLVYWTQEPHKGVYQNNPPKRSLHCDCHLFSNEQTKPSVVQSLTESRVLVLEPRNKHQKIDWIDTKNKMFPPEDIPAQQVVGKSVTPTLTNDNHPIQILALQA